jgi:putative alpha-1,2-mannosidase
MKLTIIAEGLSKKNVFIQRAQINGKVWDKAWFQHKDIISGAEIVLVMGDTPSSWGQTNPPPSISNEK